MRELYITLACLGFFFSLFLLFLFTKQQQERKMQEANEPGTGVQIRRDQGRRGPSGSCGAVNAAGWPGALSKHLGRTDSPRGSRQKESGWADSCPQISGSTTPLAVSWLEALEAPCLEARSPEHGPSGARQKGEAGRAGRGL